jgi:hypothetical protein
MFCVVPAHPRLPSIEVGCPAIISDTLAAFYYLL